MLAFVILLLVFGGIGVTTYIERAKREARALPSAAPAALPASEDVPAAPESLALLLPEPARAQAWALLCLLQDSPRASSSDPHTAYLLTQTRQSYLPDTLRAYLDLTPRARAHLNTQGKDAEALLTEQLELMRAGVEGALRRDYAAADRLLTQSRFLQERFGGELGSHERR